MFELNKKLKMSRKNGSIFKQINKLSIKFYSNLSNTNVCYHIKIRKSMCHRQFFKTLSRNPKYVETHCNDTGRLFYFAIGTGATNYPKIAPKC